MKVYNKKGDLIFNGANFQDADLRNADFENKNLSNLSFRNADLRGANFYHANLWRADIQGANIKNANFYRANLQATNILNVLNKKIIKHVETGLYEIIYIPEIKQLQVGCVILELKIWRKYHKGKKWENIDMNKNVVNKYIKIIKSIIPKNEMIGVN